MKRGTFRVALGSHMYRVERPWGEINVPGKITDIAIDALGRAAVLLRTDPYTEEPSSPVQLITVKGKADGSFGAADVMDAHKITSDHLGHLWVVDRDAHQIVRFNKDGQVVALLGKRDCPEEPFNHPSDIAFGADGTIVVADGYASGKVHIFSQDLKHRKSFGSVGIGPGEFMTVHGIWVTLDGRIVVADRENNRLQVFDLDGKHLAIWTGFHRPSDIWGDSKGRLYVSDGVPTLTCLSPQGERLGRCRPVLNGAHGISGSADGTIYLAEGTPSRITRLVPEI